MTDTINYTINYFELSQQLQAERDAAIACAEAAEAELESALAVVDLYQTRAMAAEAEVAALRADLAALRARLTEYDEEWRPCPDATDDEAVTT